MGHDNEMVLYPSYSTHLSNLRYKDILYGLVLYPSYSTHLSNHNMYIFAGELVLYPSYSTHLSNLKRVVYKVCNNMNKFYALTIKHIGFYSIHSGY